MTPLRTFLSRLLELVHRGRRDARLSEEIEAHLDLLTDEHIARGLSRADARLAARRAFGGVDQVKLVHREQRGLPLVDSLLQDVRFAVRLLLRERGFTTTVVLVLGLGIGVNNMQFAVFYAHLLRGLPIPEADRVLHISTIDELGAEKTLSYDDFQDLRRGSSVFAGLAAFTNAAMTLSDRDRAAERIFASYVSADAFAVLGLLPIRGRSFIDDDERVGAPAVAMLGSGVWETRYGADESIIGRSVVIDGMPTTVVGIMDDRSGFPSGADVFLPLSLLPEVARRQGDAPGVRIIGRLREDVTREAATAEAAALTENLIRSHPETSTRRRARVIPINERVLGRMQPAWFAFLGVGVLILAISCANVGNLMLARAVRRTREVAIRSSLGAARFRIVRQLLVEGFVIATLGGLVGLAGSVGGLRLFGAAVPANLLPYWMAYEMDRGVFLALVAASFVTVFVFALVPALYASRADANIVLRSSGRAGTPGTGEQRWTAVFLTAELALAVVMLANLILSMRLSGPSLPSDRTLETENVLTAAINLPPASYPDAESRSGFYRHLTDRIGGIPGVTTAAVASHLPLFGAVERQLELEGQPIGAGDEARKVWAIAVGSNYFDVLGLPLVRGRAFADGDGVARPGVAIVNERFAQVYLPDRDPIGVHIKLTADQAEGQTVSIVAIAPTVRREGGEDPEPIVYVPLDGAPPASAALLVRTTSDAGTLTSTVREAAAELDPALPLYRTMTLAQAARDATWVGRVSSTLLTLFVVLALGLSSVGLYAVTAHAVGLRSQEIGLRMALGARRRQVIGLILRRVAGQVALGLAVGVVCTLGWDVAFGTGAPGRLRVADPAGLAIVAATIAALAVVACLMPVRSAIRLDPAAALRDD